MNDSSVNDSSVNTAIGVRLDDDRWFARLRSFCTLPPPARLGQYDILDEIGRGGQGVVYKARQPRTERIIAIKRLTLGAASDSSFRTRFEREIRTAAALNHPNVVTVFGGEMIDGAPVLLMEYIDGVPMDRWAASAGAGLTRNPRGNVRVFERLCTAVAHAHQQGVIHRDLKPSNVLIDRQGEPHVLDFGLARLLSPFVTDSLFATHTTGFVGTPLYASPEHFAGGDAAVDVRSNVYAVGVMLYQALTGRLPYAADGLSALIRAIAEQEPARPLTVAPHIGRELDAVVQKAMVKPRDERYQSMDALAADLRRYLNGEAVLAHPPSVYYQMRKLIRRHKVAFGFTAVLALSLVGFAVTAGVLGVREHHARMDADRNAYVASIAGASAALRADDVAGAQECLQRAPVSLRNWEWRHLLAQADNSTSTFQLDGRVAAAFDGSGRPIVTVKNESEWHTEPGRPCATLHVRRNGAAVLSPGLRFAFAPGSGDRADGWQVLDVASRRAMLNWEPAAPIDAAFSPDEQSMLFWGPHEVVAVRISAATNGGAASRLQDGWSVARRFKLRIEHAAFHPDSRLAALCATEPAIRIVDLESFEAVRTLSTGTRPAWAAVFSPDGRRLAAGTLDGRVTMWEWESGRELWSSTLHRELICDVAFSPDGGRLASASWDRTIRVWDGATGQPVARLVGHSPRSLSVAFLGDDDHLVSMDEGCTAKTWRLSAQRPLTAAGEFRRVENLAGPISPSRWVAVIESVDDAWLHPRVSLVDVKQRQKHAVLWTDPWPELYYEGSPVAVELAASPDGRWLAVGTPDGTVLLWRGEDLDVLMAQAAATDVPSPALKLVCPARDGPARMQAQAECPAGLSFSSDGRRLAIARPDGRVETWDVERGVPCWTRTSAANSSGLRCGFAPDGARLAILGDDALSLLRAADGTVIAHQNLAFDSGSLPLSAAPVFSPDGSLIAVPSGPRDIALLDSADLTVSHRLSGHQAAIAALAFSPDGSRLVSASEDGTLRLWDVAGGHEVATLHGHENTVRCVAFVDLGHTIVSGALDNTVRFWDAGPAPPGRP